MTCNCENTTITYKAADDSIRTADVHTRCAKHAPAHRAAMAWSDRAAAFARRLCLPAPANSNA